MPFPPGNGVQFCQHSRRNPPVQGELNEDPQVCHFFRTLCFRLPLATSLPGAGEAEGPQFLSSCLCQAWFQVGQVKLLTRLQMSKTGQNPLKK